MLIGYSSFQRKGYDVNELIVKIGKLLDTEHGQNVGVVGNGNLGSAITAYFRGKRSKLNIVATFDVDPEKVGRMHEDVMCYPLEKLEEVITSNNISIAVITAPSEVAVDLSERLVKSGIKGILNYTSVPLNVPEGVFLEELDFTTALEKVAYYSKGKSKRRSRKKIPKPDFTGQRS
jgi:redox-sensing transcriptional repressor